MKFGGFFWREDSSQLLPITANDNGLENGFARANNISTPPPLKCTQRADGLFIKSVYSTTPPLFLAHLSLPHAIISPSQNVCIVPDREASHHSLKENVYSNTLGKVSIQLRSFQARFPCHRRTVLKPFVKPSLFLFSKS